VAVDLPRLELDRPFTYLLPEEHAPGTGLLVSVPFHGRTVRGWVLGPAVEPPGRVLPIRRVLSKVPVVDQRLLRLARWMAERYVVPLSLAIGAMPPRRVAAEETAPVGVHPCGEPDAGEPEHLIRYQGGSALLTACRDGSGAFVVRPLPDEESECCLEAVRSCLAGGRRAVVVVPEGDPLPATAGAVAEALRDVSLLYVGGEPKERYRAWLDMLAGRYHVVVGTRSAVFAPLPDLGLIWVHREAHPGHREERAPRHHVRDVALARARVEDAVCAVAGLAPSAETASLADAGSVAVVRPPRALERAAAPLVETTPPEREDRSARLGRLLRDADGAVLLVSRHGYGVARTCRRCGEPARCARCAGPVVVREGRAACAVCHAEAVCPTCGSQRFGVERGGTERLEEWAARVTDVPVTRVESAAASLPPGAGRVIVGTAAAVKDFGPARVSLVAILDPDRARRREGLSAPDQALATWMEAAAWAGPRGEGGRVLVHTREPGDPAIQALVRWDPEVLHRSERARREAAGFPPGHPVFRVVGSPALAASLASVRPVHLLTSSVGAETVSLVTVTPDAIPRFRERIVAWVGEGIVTSVEAEPQL
jgi:primosomal protein N' (replication factor Y) (superfamily II helicase)